MIRDFYELNAEYPISRTILGEERIKKSNTKAKWILVVISILIFLFCFIFNKHEYGMFIILFASIISLVVIICDNCKSIEYIKTQVLEYKPNLISYFKGVDWNNYLIEEKWIEIIEQKKYYEISTNTLKYNYAITKMELSEKPKINYSNLLNILNIIISLAIVAIITPIKEHFNIDLKDVENFKFFILICVFTFFLIFFIFGYCLILMRQTYSRKMDKYNELRRYSFAMLSIIHKRKEEVTEIKKPKNSLLTILRQLFN
ncbi:hypothetical protein [Apibacter sp. HY039]|uniref:hypothetical protein n=1 Tax=Apibacter sp. HY039 TaxID=2501476 RepID=UPI000FEC0054|nr:hypothetical protein [Apibacter sp. HY039]